MKFGVRVILSSDLWCRQFEKREQCTISISYLLPYGGLNTGLWWHDSTIIPLAHSSTHDKGWLIAYISLVTAMSPWNWIQPATWLQLPCTRNNYDWHQHRNCSQGLLAVIRFIKATDTEVTMPAIVGRGYDYWNILQEARVREGQVTLC